ncbi:MAG: helix-turn-helix transcriptional regulator [Eubacterium sp.]|nr:helix-turn-helix transcriptional regulator [Eubacterium sp.]
MTFIKRLKALMAEKKVTKAEISKELHIGVNQIKYWEDKGNTPDGATLIKLADYFGVSVDYLLGKTDKKNKTVADERSLTEAEKEIIAATADMTEDELNAVLGYAARIIAKRKKED